MRKGFLPALGVLLAGVGLAQAQYPYPYANPGYAYPAQNYYSMTPAQQAYYMALAQVYYGAPMGYANGYYPYVAANQPAVPMYVYTVSRTAAPGSTPSVTPATTLPEASVTDLQPAPEAAEAATEAKAPADKVPADEDKVPADEDKVLADEDKGAAKTPGLPSREDPHPPGITDEPICPTCCDACGPCGPRLWGRAEYLLWWLSDAPMPVPLVTNGPVASEGELGQPGTTVLFGGQSQGLGTFSGMRVNLGGWIDCKRKLGVAGGGFLLEQRSIGFNGSSDANGAPVLAVPFINVGPGGGPENAYIVTTPVAPFTGGVGAFSATRLWGADASGVLNLFRNCRMDLDVLAGFRYLDLDESLNLYVNSIDGFGDPQLTDDFSTRNQFFGGHIGTRVHFQWNKLSLDAQSRVALGTNQESVEINGTGVFPGLGGSSLPGGIFALPSNMGRFQDEKFNVIPEVQLRAGYDLLRNLRVFAGYTFIYWSDVVRPGNQVDRVINGSQIQSFLGPIPSPLVGPLAPLPQIDNSTFFAHGVSFGAEFRY